MVKIAADAMEMAIGALYVEKGFPAVRQWISRTFDPLITNAAKTYDDVYVCAESRSSLFNSVPLSAVKCLLLL